MPSMLTRRKRGLRTLGGVTAVALSLAVGAGLAAAQTTPPPSSTPGVGISVGSDGRFSMGAYPNTDGSVGPNSFKLIYGWPGTGTSFTSVRIDGVDSIFGSDPGTMTTPCSGNATQNTCVWTNGDVRVTQLIQVTANPQTGRNDAALVSYQVANIGTASHSVGVRMMLDTQLGDNDGAPFRIPGAGNVTTERDLQGADVPDDFLVFQDLASSSRVASGTLRGGFSTVPDRLVIADWRGITGTVWDYTTDPSRGITSDSAYAAYWNPTPLAGGASRTYSTYYGLGNVTVDAAPPVALGVNGPSSLTATSNGGYTPNPFTVSATVSAVDVPASNVTTTLNLPAGLSTTEPLTKSAGNLTPGGGERTNTWDVTAAPSNQPRTLQYSVTVNATGAAPKTVSRSITIPATQAPAATVRVTGSGTLPLGNENASFTLDLTSNGTQASGSCQIAGQTTNVRCTSFYEVKRTGTQVTFRGTGLYNNRQPISFTATVTDGAREAFVIFAAGRRYGGNLTSGSITVS